MKKKLRNNGFTLIELIAVLVILTIIALIVTPLVMNIVKKAKDSSNKRSVDAYGKAVELAVATYLLDNGEYPETLDNLTVDYSGNEVVCNVKTLNKDGSIYLSECSVVKAVVKDEKTEDGYYHYGKLKPYKKYLIGDVVEYKRMKFYVITNSSETQDYVTLLKAEPFTVDEVNTYGKGYVNLYTFSSRGSAYNYNGYGNMAYYTSQTCGYTSENGTFVSSGCENEGAISYGNSHVKRAIDAWSTAKLNMEDLKEDSLGYKTRLITFEELLPNLGYNWDITKNDLGEFPIANENVLSWVWNSNYNYWTMSQYSSSAHRVWIVYSDGTVAYNGVVNYSPQNGAVRPVINLLKSAID